MWYSKDKIVVIGMALSLVLIFYTYLLHEVSL